MPSFLLRAGAAAAVLGLLPAVALAADPPDIKGAWTGKTFTIVAGKGGHWPENTGTFEKPGLFEKDLTISILGQEGRRFWGKTTITGDGGPTEEPFVGEFEPNGRRVLVADTDGYFQGTIKDGIFTFCYANAGGKTETSVVSCTEVKKQP